MTDNPAAAFRLNIVSPSIRHIPDRALQNCRALTDVRVHQTGGERIILRTIGKYAFQYTRLRRINQFLKQGGVIRLEREAFMKCDRIEGELIIPTSVLWVGACCFGKCTSITSVVFEPSATGTVVEISYGAFNDCTELLSATLPPTLERIPRWCFEGCTALIHVPIPPSVMELGEASFLWCTSLPSMELPPTLERIPHNCFRGCAALIHVPIPPNIVEVGKYAFNGCASLPSMELPESVDLIGNKAFARCTALTTVTIRTRSFELRMGDGVFDGCDSLSTIRTYPWHWGKLLSSMENDANFLHNFFNGALTSLASINLNSRYGHRILEAVNEQPSLLYRVLRKFQHQRFETNAPRTTMTAQNTTDDRFEA